MKNLFDLLEVGVTSWLLLLAFILGMVAITKLVIATLSWFL